MEYRPFDYEDMDPSVPDPALDVTLVMGGSPEDATAVHDALTGEVPAEDQNERDIAYHAARMLVAERKADKAADTMEKMDRKERLYLHLGGAVLGSTATITEPDGSTPRPKTWTERFMDTRGESKSYAAAKKEYMRKRVAKIYGGEASNTMGYKTAGSREMRLAQAERAYSNGDMTAGELRREKMSIEGSPTTLTERERQRAALDDDDAGPNFASELPAQKRTRKRSEGAQKKAKRVAGQPIAGRWREMRYNRAERKFNEQAALLEEHQEALRRLDPDHPLLAYEEDDDDIINPADLPTLVAVPPSPGVHDFSDMIPPSDPDALWARDDEDEEDDEEDDVLWRAPAENDDDESDSLAAPLDSDLRRGRVIPAASREATPSRAASAESDPRYRHYFDTDRLAGLDSFISQSIRDAARWEREQRGVDQLPDEVFDDLKQDVKDDKIRIYLGDDAEEDVVEAVSRALYKLAEARGKISRR